MCLLTNRVQKIAGDLSDGAMHNPGRGRRTGEKMDPLVAVVSIVVVIVGLRYIAL
jgi:hypothetical protein